MWCSRTATARSAPLDLVNPAALRGPAAPGSPCGMLKFSTAAELVPEFVTLAGEPAARVVVTSHRNCCGCAGGSLLLGKGFRVGGPAVNETNGARAEPQQSKDHGDALECFHRLVSLSDNGN